MREQFTESLKREFEANLEGISPLQKAIREKAFQHFLAKGLPTKKLAGYHYFPFSHFFGDQYQLAPATIVKKEQVESSISQESRRSHILFINGQYSPALSDTSALPKEVVVLRLVDALKKYGNFLQMRLSRSMNEEVDPFATLNIALIQMGLFLYVPPGVTVNTPIQCLHVTTADRPVLVHPRIHFFVGKGSSLTWTTDHLCFKENGYLSNSVVDVALEEGAQFTHYGQHTPHAESWSFDAVRVTQKRDSTFKSVTCTTGAKTVREDYRISLLGENASCDLKHLALLHDERQSHVNVHIQHAAPHCTSSQLFKNVLADHAKASFEGKIYVEPEAQKTMAYQLNNNLLLSDRAMANSKPNLEIFADDVKASHGATTGTPNKDHLHYLKTRGIAPKEANLLLLSGYCMDILRDVSFAPAREKMQSYIERFLK